MSLGPIELLVVKFPGNQFRGEIVPALKELVEGGIIRIVDILFLHKGADGRLTLLEINDLEAEMFGLFDPIVSDLTKLLSKEDADQLSRFSISDTNRNRGLRSGPCRPFRAERRRQVYRSRLCFLSKSGTRSVFLAPGPAERTQSVHR